MVFRQRQRQKSTRVSGRWIQNMGGYNDGFLRSQRNLTIFCDIVLTLQTEIARCNSVDFNLARPREVEITPVEMLWYFIEGARGR